MSKIKKNTNDVILKNIIDLRKSLGYSQSEFARKIEVSAAMISKVELGQQKPTLFLIEKVAHFCEIPMSRLFGEGKNDKNKNDKSKIFSLKFKNLMKLSEADQSLIISFINRLIRKK